MPAMASRLQEGRRCCVERHPGGKATHTAFCEHASVCHGHAPMAWGWPPGKQLMLCKAFEIEQNVFSSSKALKMRMYKNS
jgi:hypothetical protein